MLKSHEGIKPDLTETAGCRREGRGEERETKE